MAERCKARIYKRDTYRYSGGRSQFKMHYTQQRCSRIARDSIGLVGFCLQHARMVAAGENLSTYAAEPSQGGEQP